MEIFRTLGALIEPPVPEHDELATLLGLGNPPPGALYSDLFLFQLYPYASVYLGPEGMMGGEARDRIAGFWRVLGEEPPPESDHLSIMLALYARLCDFENGAKEQQQGEFWAHARRAFFWEHLASWIPVFLDALASITDSYYGRWGVLLGESLAEEAAKLEPPQALSLHLREADPLDDPRASGGEAFVDGLLVPVRTGVILTRSDLDRAARQLDLGSRAGERKFVLKALLGQDPRGTLEWLEREVERWREIHARRSDAWASVSAFWQGRAARASEMLGELRREGVEA
jgi:hypothetical protein